MSQRRRTRSKGSAPPHAPDAVNPAAPTSSPTVVVKGLAALACVVAAGIFWQHESSTSPKGLSQYLLIGQNRVEIRQTDSSGAGIFAKTAIKKNEVMYAISAQNTLASWHIKEKDPDLDTAVIEAVKAYPVDLAPHPNQVLLSFALAQHKRRGLDSPLSEYIRELPENCTTTGWYWSSEEVACTVSGLFGAREAQLTLTNFREIIRSIQDKVPSVAMLGMRDLEWAYLMVKTRSMEFDTGTALLPFFDMANHNPYKGAVPVLIPRSDGPGTFYAVSTGAINVGDEIFASYGVLPASRLAWQYGFADADATAVVESQTLRSAFLERNSTRSVPQCTDIDQDFFSVQRGHKAKRTVVEATLPIKFGTLNGKPLKQKNVFSAGLPRLQTLECAQVYLQDRDQRAVASLLVKYLSQDIAQLQSKLDAPQCSGRTASMVLIQDTNRIIVENLIAVRTVVETAARGGRWTTIEKLAEDGWAK